MKNLNKIFCICLISLIMKSSLFSQTIPIYFLEAYRFEPDYWSITNYISFDIHIVWVNPQEVSEFQYAGGQFFFTFNTNIANGGTLSYSYDTVGMSTGFDGLYQQVLRPEMRPRNPQIFGNQLRLAINSFPGAGNGQLITTSLPNGCLVTRMKISTSAPEFATQLMELKWTNQHISGLTTKIFAYVGTTNTNITDTIWHHVNFNHPLPIELSDFVSQIFKNNVMLRWTTLWEKNNQGFDIERSDKTNTVYKKIGFIRGIGNSTEPKDYNFADNGLNAGKYSYRLKQLDFNGHFEYFILQSEVDIGLPSEFSLSQNFPNPFNPSTKIKYELPYDAVVKITVYDISGREVRNLVNGFQTAGYYSVNFYAGDLSSGVHFYTLIIDENVVDTKRMILLK